MTTDDDALVRGFESASLPTSAFSHVAHVDVAWCFLPRDRFALALDRFSLALRAYAAAKGVPNLYHETLTVAWMALIHERLERGDNRQLSWDDFAAGHPELFEKPSLVTRYYDEATLKSARAIAPWSARLSSNSSSATGHASRKPKPTSGLTGSVRIRPSRFCLHSTSCSGMPRR